MNHNELTIIFEACNHFIINKLLTHLLTNAFMWAEEKVNRWAPLTIARIVLVLSYLKFNDAFVRTEFQSRLRIL
jgi:hypothetical protein